MPHGSSYVHDAGQYFPVSPVDGSIHIESSYGLNAAEQARGHYAAGEGVTGTVIRTGRPMVVSDVSDEPLFLNRTRSRNLRRDSVSFICVPIRANDQAIGAPVCGSTFRRCLHAGRGSQTVEHHSLHACPRGHGTSGKSAESRHEPHRNQRQRQRQSQHEIPLFCGVLRGHATGLRPHRTGGPLFGHSAVARRKAAPARNWRRWPFMRPARARTAHSLP